MMQKGWKALAVGAALAAVSGLAQAKQVVCVFDLVGKMATSML